MEKSAASIARRNLYRPQKRRIPQNDPFFLEGNLTAHRHVRQLNSSRHVEEENEVMTTIPEVDEVLESIGIKALDEPIVCHEAPGCDRHPLSFWSTIDYEQHYRLAHWYRCETCRDRRVFPGEFWLQLHFTEFHDPQIAIRRERGEKTYQCYVEGCQRKFATPRTRRLHLVDAHQFPRSFRFDLVANGLRSRVYGGNKGGNRRTKHRSYRGVEDASSTSETMEEYTTTTDHMDESSSMALDDLSEQLQHTSIDVPKDINVSRLM